MVHCDCVCLACIALLHQRTGTCLRGFVGALQRRSHQLKSVVGGLSTPCPSLINSHGMALLQAASTPVAFTAAAAGKQG